MISDLSANVSESNSTCPKSRFHPDIDFATFCGELCSLNNIITTQNTVPETNSFTYLL